MNPDRHLILQSTPLFNALEKLSSIDDGVMTLLAADADGRLTGTLTDGDIRRALLRGVSLQTRVADVMNSSFRRISANDPDIEELRRARRDGIRLLPVVDADGRLSRLLDMQSTASLLPLSAILMAGGRGERLRPLTLDCPKPLLKVGQRAIIDYNIAKLAKNGITDVTATVNYLAERLEEHFATPVEGIKVKTVREPMPMGTIGSAALVERPDPDGATIVMNSDLLTSINLEEMWLRHRAEKADITVAATPYVVSVPFAVLSTKGSRITALEEKPSMSFWTNAGIYIVNNRLLDALPRDRRTDATDLIETTIASGGTVTYFPLDGTWIDIGSPADYRHACDLMALRTNS